LQWNRADRAGFDGLRVVVYPNDYRPAHVHVIGHGCEAVFNLNLPGGTGRAEGELRFSRREIDRILDFLDEHIREACQAREEIHDID
jgi:hypothetical protein